MTDKCQQGASEREKGLWEEKRTVNDSGSGMEKVEIKERFLQIEAKESDDQLNRKSEVGRLRGGPRDLVAMTTQEAGWGGRCVAEGGS